MLLSSNPNTLWATTFVNSLAQSGLTAVSIAPGSRSTPLTLAFHAHPDIRVYRHLDERSAGFFALGMALASDRPAALVCTSGTAVANFLPAIIEAKMSHVPLLILTADRPPELRHSGANQTIDQIKIYGDQVLWSVDAALPEPNPPAVALRNLQTLAARAYATANGITKGPVHINFPFRKPLQPASGEWRVASDEHSQFTIHNSPFTIQHGRLHPTDSQLAHLSNIIAQQPRGLIVCGPRCPGDGFPQAVTVLAKQSGYPILADPLSGLRFNRKGAKSAEEESPKSAQSADNLIIGGYETFLQSGPGWEEPQVIIRFGAVPLSKWLNAYLERIRPAHRIHIRENGVWADDGHRTNWFLQANETAVCRELTRRLPERADRKWETAVLAIETAVWHKLDVAMKDIYFDGAIVADVINNLPDDSLLFMGNSLPVRHLDQFGRPSTKTIRVFANRGASGIDGNISTALGIAAATGKEVTAVVGDITFYHDMNGLLAVASGEWQVASKEAPPATRHPLRATIIIINNNSGGIFRRLPVSQHEPPFTDLFLTPHGLDFEHAARLYGLDFVRVTDREAFRAVFSRPYSVSRIIEVVTDGREDYKHHQEIVKIVNC